MDYLEAATVNMLGVSNYILCQTVLKDPSFATAPGSTKFHHDYEGGLAHHTAEVVQNCIHLMGDDPSVDVQAVLVAAIWHDYMKVCEYVLTPAVPAHMEEDNSHEKIVVVREVAAKPQKIERTRYSELISHVTGSVICFRESAAMTDGLSPEFIDHVTHIMLSHHGRLEWRSPVEPKTPEAWILHAADMLSAQPLKGN